MNLLDKVYLPQLEKDNIRNSESYKLLKDNNLDPTVLEGYESNYKDANIQIKDFDSFINEGGTKEDWIAQHVTPENKKAFFGTIGDFIVETGKDTLLSLGVAGINGADVAVNMMPLVAKVLDNSPLATALPKGFMNAETEADVYNAAKYASENLDKAREYLKSFKEDDNVVSQLIGIMGQDFVYSIPIYNKLKSLGVPNYPAFFISGGIGGAIGVEEKVLGEDSYFSKNLFAKDIAELKNLIGILPNTPEDKIADEVVQALEYGSFSVAIPGIIDAFKFMKRYIPAFSATAGVGVGMTADNEAEGSPFKAIVNAVNKVPVFKSSVITATEKLPKSGTAEQIYNTIKNTPGVKETELKWIGLESFLKDKKNISKEEITNFIEANKIDVSEVMFPRAGKDFGMYNDMLQSVEQRQIDFTNRLKNLRGGDQRIDFDNIYLTTKYEAGGKSEFERITFYEFDKSPTGRLIKGFDDPNTFDVDINAIKNEYRSDEVENSVDFYIVRDIERQYSDDIAISKSVYENPSVNKMITTVTRGEEVGRKYELQFINNMTNDELEKFALEYQARSLRGMRAEQEGKTRYKRYTEPGGENYKELIFKYKQKGTLGGDKPIPVETRVTKAGNIEEYGIEESPHFGEMGEIAHVRFKTREIPGPKAGVKEGSLKVLSVEEMQSDLVQQVKRLNEEFLDDKTSFTLTGEVENMEAMDYVITDFPFKNNWYELVLKRLVRYAADNGFDAISIPKGIVVQDRYNLVRKFDSIEIGSFDLKRREIGLEAQDQNGVLQISELFKFEDVEKRFGKDVADRIINKGKTLKQADYDNGNNSVTFNQPIIEGGQGKNELYDKTIPSYMKKYAKKWNAKVYDDKIEIENQAFLDDETGDFKDLPVTVLELTSEMKQSVQTTSQPLFEIFGTVGLSTWGAKAVQDSIENNIISQNTN